MAEFNSAKVLANNYEETYSTDVMTGDRDKRMYLYYQLVKRDDAVLGIREELRSVINHLVLIEQMKDVIMNFYLPPSAEIFET